MLSKKTVRKLVKKASFLLIYFIQIYLCFLALETGSVTVIRGVIPVSISALDQLLNIIIISLFGTIIYLIIGNFYISCGVTMFVFSILAIVNHYVAMLHGMPLSFQELQNFRTAMNVISGADITFDVAIFKIAALFFISVFISALFYFINKEKNESWGESLWRRLVYVIISFGLVDLTLLSPVAIKPDSILAWSWREVYPVYGYALCSLESYQNLYDVVTEPENYSVADIPKVNLSTWYSDERPDVILILNETFYDFNLVTDLQTDAEYLPYISKMDNLKRGYAVVPNYGGGTNATEYELLTGNSNRLINNDAPFNVMDMNGALSIVSVMNDLGYETTAMHSESGSNYSRYRGYDELGFNNIYFGESFTDLKYYGQRAYATDQSLYDNLISKYEDLISGEAGTKAGPQFMYLLTIQNHAGWNQNPESDDIIHSERDYGGVTQEMNEYLSCTQLSDEAFYNLTEYFKTVDRPVVVCMMGDHCPSFAYDIEGKEMSADERTIKLRSTPFVMWSNRPWAKDNEIETISANFVVPFILRELDLPRPPYYQYMTQLSGLYPIVTSDMKYVDRDGSIHTYAEAPEDVTGYFFMEYNNIGDKSDRVEDLFRVVE